MFGNVSKALCVSGGCAGLRRGVEASVMFGELADVSDVYRLDWGCGGAALGGFFIVVRMQLPAKFLGQDRNGQTEPLQLLGKFLGQEVRFLGNDRQCETVAQPHGPTLCTANSSQNVTECHLSVRIHSGNAQLRWRPSKDCTDDLGTGSGASRRRSTETANS